MRTAWLLAGVLLLSGLFVAGTLVIGSDPPEDEIRDRLADSPEPEYVHASMSTTADTEFMTMVDELWATEDGLHRQEFEGETDTILIDDGEYSWEYSPDEGWATKRESGTHGDAIDSRYKMTQTLFDELSVLEIDTDEINGIPVYHVEFEPTDGLEQSLLDILRTPISPPVDGETQEASNEQYIDVDRVEIWLEKEHLFPVKTVTEEETGTFETVYENITFDPISDEKFEFDPSSDAAVDIREEVTYNSLSAARANVSIELSEPAVIPSGYELTSVSETRSTESQNTSLSLQYEGEDNLHFTLSQSNYPRFDFSDGTGESVDIGTETGYYSEEPGTQVTALLWACEGIEYFFVGHESIDKHEVIAMAESIECG